MKRVLFATVAMIGLGVAATAQAQDWNGPYIGLQGGYGWGESSGGLRVSGFAIPYEIQPTGPIGGAHLGYDWQSGHLVLGVVGDAEGGDISGQRHHHQRPVHHPADQQFRRLASRQSRRRLRPVHGLRHRRRRVRHGQDGIFLPDLLPRARRVRHDQRHPRRLDRGRRRRLHDRPALVDQHRIPLHQSRQRQLRRPGHHRVRQRQQIRLQRRDASGSAIISGRGGRRRPNRRRSSPPWPRFRCRRRRRRNSRPLSCSSISTATS